MYSPQFFKIKRNGFVIGLFEPLCHRLRLRVNLINRPILGVVVIFNFGAKTLGRCSTCYD
jgi:hypothetical protein